MTPPKKNAVRFADEPTVIEPEPAPEPEPRSEVEFEDETELQETDLRETELAFEPRPAMETDAAETTSPQAMPIEDVLSQTRVGLVNGRPVAVWLPGAEETAPRFDAKTLGRLDDVLPEGTVLVFGTMLDGRMMAGGREITVEAAASAIMSRAPD